MRVVPPLQSTAVTMADSHSAHTSRRLRFWLACPHYGSKAAAPALFHEQEGLCLVKSNFYSLLYEERLGSPRAPFACLPVCFKLPHERRCAGCQTRREEIPCLAIRMRPESAALGANAHLLRCSAKQRNLSARAPIAMAGISSSMLSPTAAPRRPSGRSRCPP